MKRFPPYVFFLASVLTATTAWGQYGLYGSPEVVPLPERSPTAIPCTGYAVPSFEATGQPAAAYPSTAGGYQPQVMPRRMTAMPGYQQMPAQPQSAQPQSAPTQAMAAPRPAWSQPAWSQPRAAYGNYYTPEGGRGNAAPTRAPRVPSPPAPPSTPAEASSSPSDVGGPSTLNEAAPAQSEQGEQQYVDYGMTSGSLTEACGGYGATCDPYAPTCDGYGYTGDACGYAPSGGGVFSTCGRMLGYECDPCKPCPWYFSAAALYLSRDDANRVWTSYETNNEPNQITNTNDIGLSWEPGVEFSFGRRLGCCGTWALEATYFTIDPFNGYHSTTHANGVSTPLTFGHCTFTNTGHGTGVNTWFDSAQEHRLWRRNEIHNIEVSLVRTRMLVGCDTPWDLEWEVGVRYFRFWESLRFGTLSGHGTGWDDLAETAYLEDQVTNNLIGAQFGFNAGWYFHRSCRLFVAPKLGLYNNHIEQYANLYRGDGEVAGVTSPSNGSFPVKTEDDHLSFLGQIDLGLDWQITRRLSAQVGYRVIFATGMALADHQIPNYINDTPEFAHVKTNGDLVLHGAFAGGTFNY